MQTEGKKCAICRTHKGKRYCLRNNKHICWICCNDLRIDSKCPSTCEYNKVGSDDFQSSKFPSEEGEGGVRRGDFQSSNGRHSNTSLQRIKTDSLAEFYDYIEKHTQLWIKMENADFNNQVPLLMKETEIGRKELTQKLSMMKLDKKVAKIYEKLLDINLYSKDIQYKISFEDVGLDFLHTMGEEKWHLLSNYFAHKDPVTVNKYIDRLKTNKIVNDMNYITVSASGISSDGHSAFSSYEINYIFDISLLFINYKNEWKIDNVIFGEINLIYSETDTIKHIAGFLSQKDYNRAYQLIKQAEEIYFLSPDVQYNKGLYYSLKAQLKEASAAFAESASLDVEFAEPVYNQAFICHSENRLEEAKRLYEKTLSIQKNNLNALNNLGTIYLYEKDYGNAKYYFQQCLEFNPEFQFAIDNLKLVEELISNKLKPHS